MARRMSSRQIEKIVLLAQRGDDAAVERILEHFETDIRKMAHSGRWFLPGAEAEDIEQEARIGLYHAIAQYDPNHKDTNFKTFALKVCVKRAIITAINRENRRRMDPLNHGVSLSTPVGTSDGDFGQTLEEFIPDDDFDVEKQMVKTYEADHLDELLKEELTPLECNSYELYKLGHTYREIAAELQETEKTVDNALMRVRNKAKMVVAKHIIRHSRDTGETDLKGLVTGWGLEFDDKPNEFWEDLIAEVIAEDVDENEEAPELEQAA